MTSDHPCIESSSQVLASRNAALSTAVKMTDCAGNHDGYLCTQDDHNFRSLMGAINGSFFHYRLAVI